jgi:hypothetical protein
MRPAVGSDVVFQLKVGAYYKQRAGSVYVVIDKSWVVVGYLDQIYQF